MSTSESELGLRADSFAASFSASFASPAAWGDANPHSHLVQFYEDDGFLIDSLSRLFADGLSAGDRCVYIRPVSHLTSLEKRLAARGIDLDKLRKEGRLISRDASHVLSTFMVDEWPDES